MSNSKVHEIDIKQTLKSIQFHSSDVKTTPTESSAPNLRTSVDATVQGIYIVEKVVLI